MQNATYTALSVTISRLLRQAGFRHAWAIHGGHLPVAEQAPQRGNVKWANLWRGYRCRTAFSLLTSSSVHMKTAQLVCWFKHEAIQKSYMNTDSESVSNMINLIANVHFLSSVSLSCYWCRRSLVVLQTPQLGRFEASPTRGLDRTNLKLHWVHSVSLQQTPQEYELNNCATNRRQPLGLFRSLPSCMQRRRSANVARKPQKPINFCTCTYNYIACFWAT